MSQSYKRGKVSIIGPGTVGMVIAHHLVVRELVQELVLVGRNVDNAEAEAMDMMHASNFVRSRIDVSGGEIDKIADSHVVVMCASAPVDAPSEFIDRNILARSNYQLMKSLLPEVARLAPEAILLMVTNPVDALTWKAMEITGFPPERVMGTGTLVDSMRFRELISKSLSIHPDDIRAYILGEHGQHQFLAMSAAQAAGEPLDDTAGRREMSEKARDLGLEIYRRKNNTCYAIGFSTVYILESILLDECRTIPLSVKVDGYMGVEESCLSVPVVVGQNGIQRYLTPTLNAEEHQAFHAAANAVKEVIRLMED